MSFARGKKRTRRIFAIRSPVAGDFSNVERLLWFRVFDFNLQKILGYGFASKSPYGPPTNDGTVSRRFSAGLRRMSSDFDA